MSGNDEGTAVAKGNHVVPKGVVVEELLGGRKKLRDECPTELTDLLLRKDCVDVYDKFVSAVSEESRTRNLFGQWRDMEIDSILTLFRDDFAEKGVQVVLCTRKSGSGTFRWLEFIDKDAAPDYVPQFDVSNRSGQVIKTVYTKIEFPNGVAVEELKRYGKARKTLKEKIPVYVEKMMEEKDLLVEYNALVDDCVEAGVGKKFKNWHIEKLKAIVQAYETKFERKGVAIFVCHKQEYVSHGSAGGHYEYFRWLEFVDRSQQPNYHPQRDAASKDSKDCVIS